MQDLGGGVFRIPLPLPNDGLRAVNVYALQTTDGLVMIDGGWALAESAEQLRGALAKLDFELGDIRRFLVTHIHRDHFTQAVAIRREFGARVEIGFGEQPNLLRSIEWADGREPVDAFGHLRRAGAGTLGEKLQASTTGGKPSAPHDWELPDGWLHDGSELALGSRTLRVIHTPGHTRGHVVFHDAAGALLFAGDHVLPQITPSIGFEPVRVALPLRDYLDSLRLMHTLPDARLLPAHGPVTASVHERVTELLAHHAERLDASEAVVQAGAASGYEAARALTWTRRRRAFEDLDLFNQVLAVSETAAHLDVLVLQGRLSGKTGTDGVEYYQ